MKQAVKIIAFVGLMWTSLAGAECTLTVERVVDGDTFQALAMTVIGGSEGHYVWEMTGFRLLRVNTPERAERNYLRAKDYLQKRIEGKKVEIRLVDKEKKRDSFGRFLVEVFLCEGTGKANINDELRARGWRAKKQYGG